MRIYNNNDNNKNKSHQGSKEPEHDNVTIEDYPEMLQKIQSLRINLIFMLYVYNKVLKDRDVQNLVETS